MEKKIPIYDLKKTYQQNLEEGPVFDGVFPESIFPPENEWIDFLGHPVAKPLGIPAGPLLSSSWVRFAARMGFDILTYKTIRSRAHPAHPLPNVAFVESDEEITPDRFQVPLKRRESAPNNPLQLALTNSFGVPSQSNEFLAEDIDLANRSLSRGQVMIVSITGTPRPGEDFTRDFVQCAQVALSGGAKIIEANFSCPNVVTCEGEIYSDPETVYEIAKAIKKSIKEIPLIIKVGPFGEKKELRQMMCAAARAGAHAICGLNAISMQVIPELSAGRSRAGICGGPIRRATLDFITQAAEINREEKLNLTLMGTGGVVLPEHFDLFFEAGAHVAMSAVGMMWDPFLAVRYLKTGKKRWKTLS